MWSILIKYEIQMSLEVLCNAIPYLGGKQWVNGPESHLTDSWLRYIFSGSIETWNSNQRQESSRSFAKKPGMHKEPELTSIRH